MDKAVRLGVLVGAALISLPMASGAAILHTESGWLLGASNVDVLGVLYDVRFLSTNVTCAELFNGCDDPSDFVFKNSTEGLAAGQALLDQVLIDSSAGPFDTQVGLAGCGDWGYDPNNDMSCSPIFGFSVYGPSYASVNAAKVYNFGHQTYDTVHWVRFSPDDHIIGGAEVWAVWSLAVSVPEPGTLALLGLGLAGLGLSRRRKAA